MNIVKYFLNENYREMQNRSYTSEVYEKFYNHENQQEEIYNSALTSMNKNHNIYEEN